MNQSMLKRQQNNAVILSIFLFQYSFLIPLMRWVNPTTIVAVSELFLVVVAMFLNGTFRTSMKIFFVYIIILLVLVIKCLADGTSLDVSAYFLMIAGPVMLVFSNPFDRKRFLWTSYKLAIANFFVLGFLPFLGTYNYMRFGYGLLLTPIFIYIKLLYLEKGRVEKLRILDLIFLVVSLAEILIFGARGCLVVLALFAVLFHFFVFKKFVIRNSLLVLLLLTLGLNILPILRFIQSFARQHNIRSHSLYQLINQLESGFAAASAGRSRLYQDAISKFRRHPLLGNPINLTETGGDYVHNLFLQVAQDLGILGLLVLVFFLLYCLFKLLSKSYPMEDKLVLLIFFSVAIGRLMFSSILWKRPEFWMLVCFALMKPATTKTLAYSPERVKYQFESYRSDRLG